MKKRLDLILNGKGGVGKSFFAINFIQFLKDRSIKHVAVDTDNENSTLKRFHPEANFLDLSTKQAVDPILRELKEHSLVVVDCRAASTDIFIRYFDKFEVFDVLKELDVSLTIILPVNNDPDSLNQIQILTEKFKDNANYVVVKNRFFGEQFEIYDDSKTRIRLLDDLNGKEIEMPLLDDWLVVTLNQSATTITRALKRGDFIVMDRQRLVIWQRDFNSQIKSARDLLLPPKSLPKEKESSDE
jgi:CobQ/CobB/MinD/ParA nucleotide binding domain